MTKIPRRQVGRYIYRYGGEGNWIFCPTKQFAQSSARNWSLADECFVEVREIVCPSGPFRTILCELLNQQNRQFRERRLSAFRRGRAIPAWEEEWAG